MIAVCLHRCRLHCTLRAIAAHGRSTDKRHRAASRMVCATRRTQSSSQPWPLHSHQGSDLQSRGCVKRPSDSPSVAHTTHKLPVKHYARKTHTAAGPERLTSRRAMFVRKSGRQACESKIDATNARNQLKPERNAKETRMKRE